MGVIVQSNYATFIARYPEFTYSAGPPLTGVSDPTYQAYFGEASIYHTNDGSGPVNDVNVQLALLNMLVAHIAVRYAVQNGQVPSALVGRINSATQGTVTVQAEFASVIPLTAAWFLQTKYGADYWQATAGYRTARYRASPGRNFMPASIPAGGRGSWPWVR